MEDTVAGRGPEGESGPNRNLRTTTLQLLGAEHRAGDSSGDRCRESGLAVEGQRGAGLLQCRLWRASAVVGG